MNALRSLMMLLSYAGLLWFVYFVLWKGVCRETFRQDLFQLRDQLFDTATRYGVPYHHPAYYTLRRRLHGFIQHPERATYLHGLLYRLWYQETDRLPEHSERAFQHALATLQDPQALVAFTALAHELNLSLRRQVVAHSAVLSLLQLGVLIGTHCSTSLQSLWTLRLPTWLNLPYLTAMAEQAQPTQSSL